MALRWPTTGSDSSLGRTAHMIHDALVYSTVKAAARPPYSDIISVRAARCCGSELDGCDLVGREEAFLVPLYRAAAGDGPSVRLVLRCLGLALRYAEP